MDTISQLVLKLLVFLLSINSTWQLSLPTDATYNAGVVEFVPSWKFSNNTSSSMLRMKQIIESEEAKDLDILVFPEYVLNILGPHTFVPDPRELIAPCDTPNYGSFLAELSCSARSRGLYVVLNLLEKEECDSRSLGASSECGQSNATKMFNTNVVFDRRGVVIARYRKTHLYNTEWRKTSVPAKPEHSTFKTDFGVTFGTFICFDMLFYDPAMVLIKELNVTDIIYPTYWYSELPFLTAIQLQEGWSYANDVNLLAAGASLPAGQNTGSGIYAGKLGRLTAVISEEPTTRLLKARVPKRITRKAQSSAPPNFVELPPAVQPIFEPQLETPRFTKLSLLRDYNVDIFATKLLAENFTAVAETVCHERFCCRFNARRTLVTSSARHAAYRYRLAAYSGSKVTFQRVDPSDLSICAVIACTTSDLWSCGHIFPDAQLVGNKYYFTTLNISGKFRKADRRLIMPSTVDGAMMPLSASTYEMRQTERNTTTDVEIALTWPKLDLLTFGIWANYYSQQKVGHNIVPPPRLGESQKDDAGHSAANSSASHFSSSTAAALILVTVIQFNTRLM